MPLYLFICPCGTSTEAIRKVGTESIACACGGQAERRVIYAPSIGQRETKYRGRDFLEASAEIAERSDELSRREGVAVKTPDFMGMATRRAHQLRAAGVTSSRDLR